MRERVYLMRPLRIILMWYSIRLAFSQSRLFGFSNVAFQNFGRRQFLEILETRYQSRCGPLRNEMKLLPYSSRLAYASSFIREKYYPISKLKFVVHKRSLTSLAEIQDLMEAEKAEAETLTTEDDLELLYQQLATISETLRCADEAYYQPHSNSTTLQPIMSDEEYDALARKEASICQAHPQLKTRLEQETGLKSTATRYGGRVGPIVDATSNARIRRFHLPNHPMLSLDNALEDDDLEKWLDRIQQLISPSCELSILVEPKLDGLSLSLRYKLQGNNYVLEWGATRGDGSRGDDVTEAVRAIPQTMIPHSFPASHLFYSNFPSLIEVRGEVILPIAALNELNDNHVHNRKTNDTNKTSWPLFANARNAASGILQRTRSASSNETKQLCFMLHFYAYDIAVSSDDPNFHLWKTACEMQASLTRAGFRVPHPTSVVGLVNNTSWKDLQLKLMDLHSQLQQNRHEIQVELDGLVYKVNELPLRKVCGYSTRAPRWAVAHKFPPKTAITRLLDIEIQVGRTGSITPVAVLEPVKIGGITISRASLHNFDRMYNILADEPSNRRIPIGTSVFVSRAGDVIPQVLRRVPMAEAPNTNDEIQGISIDVPKTCPKCGYPVAHDELGSRRKRLAHENETVDSTADIDIITEETVDVDDSNSNTTTPASLEFGRVLRCTAPQLVCDAKAVGTLVHAFSRNALDVTGLSEARIEQLRDAGILKRPSDLFRLGSNKNDLEVVGNLTGWGPKSASNLISSAKSVSDANISLARFIYSLGIRHIGLNTAKLLASHYQNVEIFLESLKESQKGDCTLKQLMYDSKTETGVKGIGPVAVKSLQEFARDETLVAAALDLANVIKIKDAQMPVITQKEARKTPISGLSVVFTGTFPGYSRKQLQDLAKAMGARGTPSSISKSTDLVVKGDKVGAVKIQKAQELGLRIMSANEFIKIIKDYE